MCLVHPALNGQSFGSTAFPHLSPLFANLLCRAAGALDTGGRCYWVQEDTSTFAHFPTPHSHQKHKAAEKIGGGGAHYDTKQSNLNICLCLNVLTSFLISPYNKFKRAAFGPSRNSRSSKIARARVKVDPGGSCVSPDSRLMVSCTETHTLYTHTHTH